MYFVEEAVPIAEIAKATRMTTSAVEDVCRDVGFVIGEDWVGRPAVTTREAWHIASGQAAERAKTERLNIDRQLAGERWTQDRNDAYNEAYSGVFEANRRLPLMSRPADAVVLGDAQQAGRDAVAEFERTHPHPDKLSQSLLSRLLGAVR
jgi:hypothetical protein